MYTRSRNIKRLEGVVSKKVQPFYDAISTLLATNKYLPQQIHNMDETGCAIGNMQRKKVLVHKDKGAKWAVALPAKQPRGKWVTSIKAIKANGEVLKPLVVLKGKTLNASWMLGEADR
jgi:transposase-like protein